MPRTKKLGRPEKTEKKNMIVTVRLTREEYEMLRYIQERTNRNASDALRFAIEHTHLYVIQN